MKNEKGFAVYMFLFWSFFWGIASFMFAFQGDNEKFFTRIFLATFCYAIYNLLKFKEIKWNRN